MQIKHISIATSEALDYIDKRRKGLITPLITSKDKLNKAIDGFTWGRIVCLAGLSGAGKSLTLEEIKRDLVDLNPKEKFKILSFEFEMLATDQVARNLSGKLNKSVRELFSAIGEEKLDEETFKQLVEESKKLGKYPIYYIDTVGTIYEIREAINTFIVQNLPKEEGLVVTIDHILLTKGMQGQEEKQIIDSLMQMLVELKKEYASRGQKVLFIILSQLNRSIETQDRVVNPSFHYPTKNDIFAASSVYYSSDIVIVLHKPSIIEGIGLFYGPPRTGYPNGLPVFHPEDDTKSMIYWHIIKSRFGSNKILRMVDDFANSRVLQYASKKAVTNGGNNLPQTTQNPSSDEVYN